MADNGVVVRPDQVSPGVLVAAVPRDAVDAAVAARGAAEKRSGGKLPAHVVAYLTMAMSLFPDDDYEEVAAKVTGSLSEWGCWDAGWSVPTASGITQARKRLGRAVMPEIFEGVAEAVATADTRGAWLQGWRLLAIDGFEADLPGTPANAEEFGYAGSGDNRSAFPKARVVALAECGTHAFLAAEVGAYSTGEKTVARGLYPRLLPGELLTADRNFYSWDAWDLLGWVIVPAASASRSHCAVLSGQTTSPQVARLEGLEPPAGCLEGTAELWLNAAESVLSCCFTVSHRLGMAWSGPESADVGSPFGSPRASVVAFVRTIERSFDNADIRFPGRGAAAAGAWSHRRSTAAQHRIERMAGPSALRCLECLSGKRGGWRSRLKPCRRWSSRTSRG